MGDVYNAFSALVPAEVPQYLMSTVNEADAKRAYSALMQFKDVVKANPITPQVKETPAALSGKLGAIDAAAAKLSAASYPFLKSAPWASDVYLKPLPGVSPNQAMKAIDNALVSMDGNLVTTAADYEKVNAALGKVIASVPSSQVMDVFNAFSKITGPQVPSNLFNMVSPSEATAAYDAFLKFKDVVKAAQR